MLSTMYLNFFIKHISSVKLMREFLMFVLKGEQDDVWILEVIIDNIRSPSTIVSCANVHVCVNL